MWVQTIRGIRVIGNRTVPAEQIIEMSGIRTGSKRIFVSEGEVRRRIESASDLVLSGLDYDYKGTLTIRVRERTGVAAVWLRGFCYVLDRDGIVVATHTDPLQPFQDGPVVLGLDLMNGAAVTAGKPFPVQDDRQMEILRRVLAAIENTNMLSRAASVTIAEDDIRLSTRERATIRLGDALNLELKLVIAREVLNLHKDDPKGLEGVLIDVASGRDAHYIPSERPTPTPWVTPTPFPTPEA